ncbi:YHS domain-containing (seleno)protein [Hyphococcus sp.]|uniref:YHS domain-containing (seleno)protein n=1 Tax=Hyphococcus sp. TaxID=2038636 RepID=UPI003CCC1E69
MMFKKYLLAVLAGLFMSGVAAADDTVYTGLFSNTAVDGYDAVSYFENSAPAKGSKDFSYQYNGAEWRFATAENLEAFKSDPDKYAPQYGGYCAWAVSQGYTARGNPENWTIVDDRLYLNYNDEIQKRWEKDIPGFVALAEENWPSVLGE